MHRLKKTIFYQLITKRFKKKINKNYDVNSLTFFKLTIRKLTTMQIFDSFVIDECFEIKERETVCFA